MDYVSLVLVFCVGALFGKYLPSYLSKKGENLATKEDIAEITREVERVKSEHTERLEGIAEHLRYRNQLRLAALDRRLQAHQEAYALWQNLMTARMTGKKLVMQSRNVRSGGGRIAST